MTGVQSLPRASIAHMRGRTHCICLQCTLAPSRITDSLSTLGSNGGDSSTPTPSKEEKTEKKEQSWRAITDIIGFYSERVSGKETCHHPEENEAKIQSLYLRRGTEPGCVGVSVQMCVSSPSAAASVTLPRVTVWVRAYVCVCCTYEWIKSQDTSVRWERNGFSSRVFLKWLRRETEGPHHNRGGEMCKLFVGFQLRKKTKPKEKKKIMKSPSWKHLQSVESQ